MMQLPRKMSAQNVMASISRTLGNRESKAPANEIRFAGDERKDKLYEPKHKQKLVRVLTVVAYVIFVSMAAILLSLYYTFLWDPKDPAIRMIRISKPECVNVKSPEPTSASLVSNDTRLNQTSTNSSIVHHTERSTEASTDFTTEEKEFLTVSTEPTESEIQRISSTVLSTSTEASNRTDESNLS